MLSRVFAAHARVGPRALALAGLALALGPGPVRAGDQGRDDGMAGREPVPEFVREDPLGGDPDELLRPPPPPPETTAAEGTTAAPPPPTIGPAPPRIDAVEGEVLTAVDGVREEDHRVRVQLEDGLARVRVAATFRNRGEHAAEVRYRLAVPARAALVALEVCRGDRCRQGRPAPAGADPAWTAYEEAVRARPARPPAAGPDAVPPVARAEIVDDARGRAVVFRAAPVPPGGRLTVRVEWLAAAPLRGGEVRLRLPSRGTDRRAANARITVEAPALLAPSVGGSPADAVPVAVEPWFVSEVRARAATAAPVKATGWTYPCGESRCARLRVAAGPRPADAPRALVLLVDASPSTEGPPRARIPAAALALLTAAPDGSTAEVWAFGATAAPVVEPAVPAARVPLRPVDGAVLRDLGSATRFDAAWDTLGPRLARRRGGPAPLVVLVGDGGVTPGEATRRAFAEARRRGVEIAAIDVGDDAPDPALVAGVQGTGGAVVSAGREADAALRDGREEALVARLAVLFSAKAARSVQVRGAPAALGALPSGEERVWVGSLPRGARSATIAAAGRRARARPAPPALARALAGLGGGAPKTLLLAVAPGDRVDEAGGPGRIAAASCPRPGPAFEPSGVSSDAHPVALADTCLPPDVNEPEDDEAARPLGRGMPAATVLGLLRQRVVPLARRCFRRDRVGRADYAVRAVFEFRLEDREVVRAEVQGDLSEPLRACLHAAAERLAVPAFEGAVVVRYPVYTARETPPPAIELAPDVAERLDRALTD